MIPELGRESQRVLSNLEILDRGGRIRTEKGELESSVYIVQPAQRRYVALTAYDNGGIPIGICDFMNVAESKAGILEAPIIRKRPDFDVPARDIRLAADVDGLYVIEGQRKNHIGSTLLLTALALSKRFSCNRFVVRGGESQAAWYEKLGGKDLGHGIYFDLTTVK